MPLMSTFVCPFCELTLPPQSTEGRAYEAIDARELLRCPCGSVAVSEVEPVGKWNSEVPVPLITRQLGANFPLKNKAPWHPQWTGCPPRIEQCVCRKEALAYDAQMAQRRTGKAGR